MEKIRTVCRFKTLDELRKDFKVELFEDTYYYNETELRKFALDIMSGNYYEFISIDNIDHSMSTDCRISCIDAPLPEGEISFSTFMFELTDFKKAVALPYHLYMDKYNNDIQRIAKEVFKLKPGSFSIIDDKLFRIE